MSAGSALSRHYDGLESGWQVIDRSADYQKLVVPEGNASEPFHRWFHLKEAYSHRLLERLLKDSAWPSGRQLRVLDPFCGSGTSLVSALRWNDSDAGPQVAIGVERNPLIATVADAKVASILRGAELADVIDSSLSAMWQRFYRAEARALTSESSTLNDPNYFDPSYVHRMLAAAYAVRGVQDDDARAVLQTCLAASVEPAGMLRRDGRALRYDSGRQPRDPIATMRVRIADALTDIRGVEPIAVGAVGKVVAGDARSVDKYVGPRRFDLIAFSPPYPNNIDYTEVYKLEAWALGLWDDPGAMRDQRRRTLRSHPSIQFDRAHAYESTEWKPAIDALLAPILAAIPNDRYARGRTTVVRGYADDMLQVLIACRKVVATAGQVNLVVGNSIHGHGEEAFVIAADVIIARLAEIAGWHVEELRVARSLRRRGSQVPHLRETVVVLTPS